MGSCEIAVTVLVPVVGIVGLVEVDAVVMVLVVVGTAEMLEVEVTAEAAVPSNAVANTKVPLGPAAVGMMVARAVES